MKRKWERAKHVTKRAIKNMHPKQITKHVSQRKIIQKFADDHGMVYFGLIEPGDDHKLVRGITSSKDQRDAHYCIGTYDGYDVAFAQRRVLYHPPNGKPETHNWLVFQFDLKFKYPGRHILAVNKGFQLNYNRLLQGSRVSPIADQAFASHDPAFTQFFTVFADPSRPYDIAYTLPSDVSTILGRHFRPLSVEITEDCVYIYADNQKPSEQLMDVMIQDGVWLAERLDAISKYLTEQQK